MDICAVSRCEVDVRLSISARRHRTAQLDIATIDTLIQFVIVLRTAAVVEQFLLDQSHLVAIIHKQTAIRGLHTQLVANRMLHHLTSNHATIVQIDHIAVALRHCRCTQQGTDDQKNQSLHFVIKFLMFVDIQFAPLIIRTRGTKCNTSNILLMGLVAIC